MIDVLIVEDELIEAYYLKKIIEQDSAIKVKAIVRSAKEAQDILKQEHIDIIFMDIMIKGPIDGSTLAVEISQKYKDVIIIFLTAYSDKEMIENAIASKAFAYLIKPYHTKEIEATIALAKAKLKINSPKNSNILELIDNYYFDFKTKQLYKDGKVIELSKKELELIKILCENSQQILDTTTILERLEITPQALRALIYRLRHHLSKELIKSIKRYGYKIATS